MEPTLQPDRIRETLARLSAANQAVSTVYPGDRSDRQPVHTVYGGAHLFTSEVSRKLGGAALRTLTEFAPDFCEFARALELPGAAALPAAPEAAAALAARIEANPDSARAADPDTWLAHALYSRVVAKLEREPIEDHRLDFEDGYGNRSDEEEDGHAVSAAHEVGAGFKRGILPPFIGIRIKPLTEELRGRSLRTLDLFVSTLALECGGHLPDNFVVTLPKITTAQQISTLVDVLEMLEKDLGLTRESLQIELMVEATLTVIDPDGRFALPEFIRASRGRCRGAHFGTYDYTAGCNLVAAQQKPNHPACDFARHVMQVTLAGTGVTLSDGATALMPVGPHRAAPGQSLTPEQLEENVRAVRHAWKVHFDDVQSSLRHGYYQGWDLNPGQFATRYAAVFAFFLTGFEAARARLSSFIDKAAQATLLGNVFDDAATGQGLLNFFLRGLSCGAITEAEALSTGLTLEELRSRSFVKILKGRKEKE